MKNRIITRELQPDALPQGYRHIVYDLTDSTMNDMNAAMQRAVESGDNIHGFVIQALNQTAGRGSRDLKTGLVRQWQSSEENLMFSMAVSIDKLHHREVYLLGALLVYHVIQNLDSIKSSPVMKIPNDIYLEGKKICGVLTHQDFCMENWCNLGIGVNIHHAPQIKDGRNVSACLQDFGWPKDKKPEEFLKLFLNQFQENFDKQCLDRLHVWKSFGLMDDDGFCHVTDIDNPTRSVFGQYKGFKTVTNGDDYLIIQDKQNVIHEFNFLRIDIQHPSNVHIILAANKNIRYIV